MRAASEAGDYIAWCSDDDRFAPEHLRTSVEFLERNPQIGMVHSSFIDSFEQDGAEPVREPRQLRSARPIAIGAGRFLRYMARYYDWPFHPSTIVMRREVWGRVGEFDRRFQLADTDWFVRAAQVIGIAWLPRYGAINRRRPMRGTGRTGVGSAGMQREIFPHCRERDRSTFIPETSDVASIVAVDGAGTIAADVAGPDSRGTWRCGERGVECNHARHWPQIAGPDGALGRGGNSKILRARART